jgi:AcrR family transcriptional regulator
MEVIMPTPLPFSSTRRERRSTELRERLFHAAIQLFAQKGFSETTVEDITNAADVGKGTFFNYFPSKEHILAAFGRMQIGKVQAAADAAPKTPLTIQAFLRNLALDVLSEPGQNPAVVRALLQANLSSEPVREAMRGIHRDATAFLARIIEVGQQRGEIRNDLEAGDIAPVLRQSLLGALLIWSLYGDGSLESRIETVLKVLWNGLTSPGELHAPKLPQVEGRSR